MSVEAKLVAPTGSFAITNYLDVQAGQGMDPADPQFTNKVFAHSLLKAGGTLALEDFKLRELTFPLLLRATSKDALTAFVREINKVINSAGCELEWKDEGSSIVTFFQLASGQCDPEYDFRQGQTANPLLKCKLRLFVQPLAVRERSPRPLLIGGTAAANGATVAGLQPITIVYGGSAIIGDAPALVRTSLYPPSNGLEGYSRAIRAVSVLPASGYIPVYTTNDSTYATKGGAKPTVNAAAMEGKAFGIAPATISKFTYSLPPATLYAGPQRMFLVAQASPANLTEVYAEWPDWPATRTETVKINNATVWGLMDMGVINVPSAAIAENEQFSIRVFTSAASTAWCQINGIILLPDNTTSYFNEEQQSEKPELIPRVCVFDGVTGRVVAGVPPSGEEVNGVRDVTGGVHGALPLADPENGAPVVAVLDFPAVSTHLGSPNHVTVNVLERTRYVF